MKKLDVKVGATTVRWAARKQKGEVILDGICGVKAGGVELMDASFPSRLVFFSPDGWDYRAYRLIAREDDGENAVLRTEALGAGGETSWLRDHYDYDIQLIRRPRPAPRLFVDFVLSPRREKIRGRNFRGFHLACRFRCEGGRIGRFEWRQHWEIGGRATGNTVYFQSQVTSPVHRCTLESEWSNTCWKTLEKPFTPDNVSMQLNTRAGIHQLFDLLRAPQGVLLGYFPDSQAVHTVCRKNAGEDNYHVFERVECTLAESGTVRGKTILFGRGAGATETETRNIWWDMNRRMQQSYRAQHGLRESRVLPTFMVGGWATRPEGDRLYLYDHPADKFLESLEGCMRNVFAQGIRRFWFRPYCTNDVTELFHLDRAGFFGRNAGLLESEVCIGSCCCVWEYKPSKLFGGGDAARRFYEIGHGIGLQIGMWVGNHLSPHAPVLKEHPDWVLLNSAFKNASGGYPNGIMAAVNWNSGARDWILQDVLDWKEKYGLDFIFFDSFGNLGLKTRNYADRDMAENYEGVMKFLAAVSQAGIDILPEGLSFIGCPHFGISNDGNLQSTQDPLVGQNSLSWFLDEEDMLAGTNIGTHHNPKVPPERIVPLHFRAIANQCVIDYRGGPEEAAIHNHYRVYDRVEPLMQRRTLLEDGLGVLWEADDGRQVFFSYRAGVLPLSRARSVARVTPEGEQELGKLSRVEAGAFETYRIG